MPRRPLTEFQKKYWSALRIRVFRVKWRTFEDADDIAAYLNRLDDHVLLPLNAYRCRMMAADLRIKRPPGYDSVRQIRQQNAGSSILPSLVKSAIKAAKRLEKRETDRERRLVQKRKMQQEQEDMLAARMAAAPPAMVPPPWMAPNAPPSKPKRRAGRPFSMMAMRGKDPNERTVLEQKARAGLGRLFVQRKER